MTSMIFARFKRNMLSFILLLFVILTVVGSLIGATWFGENQDLENRDYWMNLATEGIGVLASIVITIAVLIIDRRNAKRDAERDRERQTQDLKDRLVREAGSRSNNKAISAVEQLRDKGWLTGDDGLLKEANLSEANLGGANLGGANLQCTKLIGANLQGTNLWLANLQEADLGGANLQKATLAQANLQGAKLAMAKLQEADLLGANLQKADLMGVELQKASLIGAYLQEVNLATAYLQEAKLQGAYLRGATLQAAEMKGAILPDETVAYKGTDWRNFTDPTRPEFEKTLQKVKEVRKQRMFND